MNRLETQSNCRAKKVLIVDDDPIILKTTAMKLKAQGYEVATAADGAEAITASRDENPDLILLDICFPPDVGFGGGVQWDGFLILSWLRRFKEMMSIPVIVMTAGDAATYKQRSLDNGALAYFHKPLNHDRLLKMIDETIATQGPEKASPAHSGVSFSN